MHMLGTTSCFWFGPTVAGARGTLAAALSISFNDSVRVSVSDSVSIAQILVGDDPEVDAVRVTEI